MMLQMIGADKLTSTAKPMVIKMSKSFMPALAKSLVSNDNNDNSSESIVNIAKIRLHIDKMMDCRLEQLTPDVVEVMMEGVIRKHLGWLVVWGNIFWGIIGIIAAGVAMQTGV